jgi:hypothetical protein
MRVYLAFILIILAACSDGGSSADLAMAPDMALACGATVADACNTCMAGACCDALAACNGDPDCVACTTGADADACERTPETHDRVNAFLVCRGGACRTDCIGTSGETCGGQLTGIVSTACQVCLEGSCCDEVAACKGSDGCWNNCLTNFSEAGCHGDPDGHAIFHALNSCVASSCDTACK